MKKLTPADRLARTRLGRRLAEDEGFRLTFMAGVNLAVNLVLAVYHGILGLETRSWWFIAMFAWYTVLTLMRYAAVRFGLGGARRWTAGNVLRLTGGGLLLLGVILAGLTAMALKDEPPLPRALIPLITLAAFTFAKVALAVVNTLRAMKRREPLGLALRDISLSAALASLLTLERTMIASLSGTEVPFYRTMSAALGFAVFAVITALGVSLLITGRRLKR